jgi:hypothetical protein
MKFIDDNGLRTLWLDLKTRLAGKLGAAAQAADSAKLGGQLPSYYATAAALSQISGAAIYRQNIAAGSNAFTIYSGNSGSDNFSLTAVNLTIPHGHSCLFFVNGTAQVSNNFYFFGALSGFQSSVYKTTFNTNGPDVWSGNGGNNSVNGANFTLTVNSAAVWVLMFGLTNN